MLKKNKITINGADEVADESVEMFVRQQPNKKILGFWRFYLGAYNFFHYAKDDTPEFKAKEKNRLTRWRLKVKNSAGEPPVVIDTVLSEKSVQQILIYLKNKGYYNAKAEYEVQPRGIFCRKCADVEYTITPGRPYVIDSLLYEINNEDLSNESSVLKSKSIIKVGKNLDVDVLEAERRRLQEEFQNLGFYDFADYHVRYKVDTIGRNNNAKVIMIIDGLRLKDEQTDSFYVEKHKKYFIRDIYIQTDYDPLHPTKNVKDTTAFNEYKFINMSISDFKPSPLIRAMHFKPGDTYMIKKHKASYKQLTMLGMFKYVRLTYKTIEGDGVNYLDIHVQLSAKKKHSVSMEGQATFREGLGGGGVFIYKRKNPFKGSEQLEFRMKGFFEYIKTTSEDERNISTNIGPQVNISYPRLLFLPKLSNSMWKKSYPQTTISGLFNFQNRVDYTRWVFSGKNTYQFYETEYKVHRFTIPEISVSYIDKSSSVLDSLDFLNSQLAYSFQDHITAGVKYSFIYDGQRRAKTRNYSFLNAGLTVAGLLGSLLNETHLFATDATNAQTIGGIRYGKFVKVDADYRRYLNLSKYHQIVLRSFVGAGIPYGKGATAIPFDQLYFTGGANSNRGWKPRILGPGSTDQNSNIDRLGEIKLELNFEYRFAFTNMLKAAIFMDAGNVWRLEDELASSNFEFNRFYKELGVSQGVGLRFDFGFFLFRLDWAMRVKQPWTNTVWTWHVAESEFNIGIGYPF